MTILKARILKYLKGMRLRASNQLKTLSIFGLTWVFSLAAWCGPTSSGGGGNICYLKAGPELLDMVRSNQVNARPSRQPGLQIRMPRGQFAPVALLHGPLQTRVNLLVEPLRHRLPRLAEILDLGLRNDWLLAMKMSFGAPLNAALVSPLLCNESNVRAVIGLRAGLKFVSVRDWNQLDLDTQAFLLIHEGWRFAQKVVGMSIDNKTLQDLTYATIVNLDELNKSPEIEAAYLKILDISPQYRDMSCQRLAVLVKNPETRRWPKLAFLAFNQMCWSPLQLTRESVSQSEVALVNFRNITQSNSGPMSEFLSDLSTLEKHLSMTDLNHAAMQIQFATAGLGISFLDSALAANEERLAPFGINSRTHSERELETQLEDFVAGFPLRRNDH
jgi:hypothetical protein